jgi:hypothetical protein
VACSNSEFWNYESARHLLRLPPWTGIRRKASTSTGQHNTKTRGQTSMPWAEFEPTIPVSKRLRLRHYTAGPV